MTFARRSLLPARVSRILLACLAPSPLRRSIKRPPQRRPLPSPQPAPAQPANAGLHPARPTSWPRPSPSAASATSWTSSAALWGLVFLWLLLATRAAAGLAAWAQRLLRPPLDAGLLFFALSS